MRRARRSVKRRKRKSRRQLQHRSVSTQRYKHPNQSQHGAGIVNWLINHLPFELHLPAGFGKFYSFCGPGTRLEQRLAEGQRGINRLDNLCMLHDVAYTKHTDVPERLKADQLLEQGAREIVNDPSTGWGEKLAAKFVAKVMQVKQRLSS